MPVGAHGSALTGLCGRRQAIILLPECQMSRHLLVKSRALLVALHFHSPVTGIPMIRCAGCLLALGWLFPALAAPASNTLSHSVGTELVLPLG